MNSFKKGSGNLDFGEEPDETEEWEEEDVQDSDRSADDEGSRQQDARQRSPEPDSRDTRSGSDIDTGTNVRGTEDQAESYPYFVRRNNIGDERDKRLELHVRNIVTEQEPEFRNTLAQVLETDEVSKTDAREFALLYAFQNPEGVADLMRDEGFDVLGK